MLTYTYTARDAKTGDTVQAEVEAENERAAAKVLIERGLSPLEIKIKAAPTGPAAFLHRVKTKDKVIFSRQLSTLINAGLPLVQSLNTVREQISNKSLKTIVGKVINDVEAGSTLADALGRYPKAFDPVFTSLVAAGETSGTLDVSLERLANQQEKDAEIISKVRGALIYPLIVIGVLFAVVTFMLTTVLPQVQILYNSLPGTSLPLPTRLLLGASHILTHFWWALIILFIVAAVLGTRWVRTTPGRQVADRFKMRLWAVGPLFMKLYMARFARTASTLVESGVPMIKMLDTTAQAVNNVHVAASINKATEQVKGGKALSESLKGDPNFLPLVPNMIHIGEQSGSLGSMMDKLASYYEKEVDNEIKAISTIIEPALMIIIGIVALIVVAAVLLPIYGLAGKTIIH